MENSICLFKPGPFGFLYKSLSPLYRTDAKPRAKCACTLCRGAKEEDRRSKGGWGIGNINVGGKIISVARLNLRHEPTALLCRFDWLHLGRVHNRYALCARFAQSLPRIVLLDFFCEELPTSNNKSPSQEGDLGGG